MNKIQFLSSLKSFLSDLPDAEKEDILYDYNEHFTIGIANGRTEEEIAKSLGNPKSIAKEIKAEYLINQVQTKFTISNFLQALLATVGLGFFNLVFVLGPFIAIAAVLFSLFITGAALVFSGLANLLAIFLQQLVPDWGGNPFTPLENVFISLGLIAFGTLWSIGCFYLNKWFYRVTIKYLKLNLNLIVNRRNKND